MNELPAEEIPHPKPSLFARFRLPLLIAAAVALLGLMFSLGWLSGQAKRLLEQKTLRGEIEVLKTTVKRRDEDGLRYRSSIEKLHQEIEEKSHAAEEVASQVAAGEARWQACVASLAPVQTALATPTSLPAPTSKPYVRFSNSNCTLSNGQTDQRWKECITGAKSAATSGH